MTDKKNIDMNNVELIAYHRKLHILWEDILQGTEKKISKDETFNAHEQVAEEMTKRKMGIDNDGKHDSPLPKEQKTNESTSLKYLRTDADYTKANNKLKSIKPKKEVKELTSTQVGDIKTLLTGTQSLSDIARLVGCSRSSIIYHAGKLKK